MLYVITIMAITDAYNAYNDMLYVIAIMAITDAYNAYYNITCYNVVIDTLP